MAARSKIITRALGTGLDRLYCRGGLLINGNNLNWTISYCKKLHCDTRIDISECKRRVFVSQKNNGQIKSYNSTWLRHQCKCHGCRQPYSGQWLHSADQLPPCFATLDVCLDSSNDILRLKQADLVDQSTSYHETILDLGPLLRNTTSPTPSHLLTPSKNKTSLKEIEYEDLISSQQTLFRWLQVLNTDGHCLLRNVPTSDQQVAKMAELIAPVVNTIYGTVFDVRCECQPINAAYSPSSLVLHSDLAYYESPPGLQLLHCLEFDANVLGGESYLADAWAEAERLKVNHRRHFETLASTPVCFRKIHFERNTPVYMEYHRPHITLTSGGEISGINWSPPFEGELQIDQDKMDDYYEAKHVFAKMIENSSTMVQFRMQPGDLISFNNRRMLHGRREFNLNGGQRHLQGCYVNIDEYKSKLMVLKTMNKDESTVKRVFNQCHL